MDNASSILEGAFQVPKLGEGQQIRLWMPMHIIAALQQDAKEAGERHIQPIIRQILAQYYREQAMQAGVEIERQVYPAG